jgi:hypothetical protein
LSSCASLRFGQPGSQLKNDENGKLTFAVLHDEYEETLRLLNEIILIRNDIGVFHREQKVHFFQKLRQVGCGWIEPDLLGCIFFVFFLVGDLVDIPKITLPKLLALGVL